MTGAKIPLFDERSMSLTLADRMDTTRAARGLLPLCVGAGTYMFLLFIGDMMLQDSDSFWQIRIGQWIIDHAAVPNSDFYSFTHAGDSWISNAWLSQVAYSISFA